MGRVLSFALVALVLVVAAVNLAPTAYVRLLPTTKAFTVANDTKSNATLLACDEHACVPSITLKPGQSWVVGTEAPIHAVYVYGLAGHRCFTFSGKGMQAFFVSHTNVCPVFGGPSEAEVNRALRDEPAP